MFQFVRSASCLSNKIKFTVGPVSEGSISVLKDDLLTVC